MTRLKTIRQTQRGTADPDSTTPQANTTSGTFPMPSARSLAAEFGVGDGSDTVHPVDACGVMLAALQGLYAHARNQQQDILRLSTEVARCRRALAGMSPGLRSIPPEGVA